MLARARIRRAAGGGHRDGGGLELEVARALEDPVADEDERREELERRDESLASERAAQHRERGLLLARNSELQRELQELKETVRAVGKDATLRLQQLEHPRDKSPAAAEAAPAPDSVVSLCADSTVQEARAASPPAAASYQRGMEWADRVLNARDVLKSGMETCKSALSTSIESVSALAVPQAVQEQLEQLHSDVYIGGLERDYDSLKAYAGYPEQRLGLK